MQEICRKHSFQIFRINSKYFRPLRELRGQYSLNIIQWYCFEFLLFSPPSIQSSYYWKQWNRNITKWDRIHNEQTMPRRPHTRNWPQVNDVIKIPFFRECLLILRRREESSSFERAATPTWAENAPVGARPAVRIHLGTWGHRRLLLLIVRAFTPGSEW